MARFWHKPGVLMITYLALYVIAGVWATTRFPTSTSRAQLPDMGSVLIGAFLAWRVTRGSSFSRGLIIVATGVLVLILLNSRDLKSGGFVSLGLLVMCLAQVAVLVSTPVYERTRKDGSDRPLSAARLWPTPPWWLAAVALAGGLLITLLFLGSEDFQSVRCALPPSATPARCVTLAQGFPLHFLAATSSGSEAYPVIYKGAAAEDLAIWTVLSFAAGYLIWLPSRRPDQAAPAQVAAPV
jgi:hypothetical protein